MLKIVHHHIFKCAGSTFAWILQKNFPGEVLYIEGVRTAYRIRCEDVADFLRRQAQRYQAVSSHVLTIPTPGNEIASFHVSFLREPWKRIVSEYQFVERNGQVKGTIDDYLVRILDPRSVKINFQIKHSSIQDFKTGNGWDENVASIYLNRENVFFGIVELFDESMIIIEEMLASRQLRFDGAYIAPQNVSRGTTTAPKPVLMRKFVEMNRADCAWYEKKRAQIEEMYHIVDPDGSKMQDFKRRCAALKAAPKSATASIRIPPLREWARIERIQPNADRADGILPECVMTDASAEHGDAANAS